MQKLTRSFLLAGAALGLAACGDDVSVTPPTPAPAAVVTAVTVSPASISIAKGQTVVATAQVSVSSGSGTVDKTVAWSSADANIATVGAATGAITGVTPGTTTIRATAGGVTGAATVTVTLGVQSVSVTPSSIALQVGGKATPTATVTRDAGVAGTVTWTSSSPAIATVDAVTGEITAVAVGTTSIIATSTADASKTAALSVVVSAVANSLSALTVSPTSANLGIGGSIQIVPNATTVSGAAVTFTYSTSAAAVATVDSAGKVTAVGNGTAIITTTATTSTNTLSAATTINVASAFAASVSIASITQAGLGTPVNIANVGGQIEVTMNVNAGNETLDSVRVTLGGQPAATQTFALNGAPNAPVTLSINTAAYKINADSTATVSFLNGTTGVQAQLFTHGTAGPSASNTITITLNNADTFHARWTLPTTSATDANGLIWYGGPASSTIVNVIPVMYSGGTIASAIINLNDNGTILKTAAVDATSPFTATFTSATISNANVRPGVSSSLRTDGNAGPSVPTTPFANAALILAVRIDGVAPAQPSVTPNPNGRANNWVNDAVSFNTVVSATNLNGLITAAVLDAGVQSVGGVTYIARAGVDSTTAANSANITNATTLAASLTNAYCLLTYSVDALGNMSAGPVSCTNPATGGTQVGVDRAPPTIAYSGGLAANAMIPAPAVSVGGEFSVTVADTGVIGNSGMLAGSPVKVSVTVRNPAGTACVIGTGAACTETAVGTTGSGALPLVTTTTIAAQTVNGYYTYTGTAYDAAGNSTAISTSRVVIFDNVNPALTPFSLSLASNFYDGGVSQSFSALANDNIDVASVNSRIAYAGIPAIFLGSTTLNAFNAATLLTSNVPVSVTVPFFLRSVAVVTSQNPVAFGALQSKPTNLSATLLDQAGNSSGAVVSAFAAASIKAADPLAFAGAWSWSVAASVTTVSRGLTTPTATTFTADLFGPTATFNSPFARVDFYAVDVAGELRLIGSSTLLSTFDDGTTNGRRHRYAFTWTVGADANFATGTTIRAIGTTASGDALVSPASAAITINP